MGLTYKLMDDFKFNTTILQNVINTVKGNTDDEFQEHGKTFTSSTSLFLCVCMGQNVNFLSFVIVMSVFYSEMN